MGPVRHRAPYDARQVANFILEHYDAERFGLSNLKIQKILYFLYGAYSALYDECLFHNPIEAWAHGPVVQIVWAEFKKFGRNPIGGRATYLDLETGERRIADASLDKTDVAFVLTVTAGLAKHSAWHLRDQTHEPGAPWERTWKAAERSANVGMRFDRDVIRSHFVREMEGRTRN